MHIAVIGGTGHIGSYLVPRLIELGARVTSISRGQRDPYQPHGAWSKVDRVALDRDAAEAAGEFGSAIAALNPDVVIDLICFSPASARQLARALAGRVQQLLHCGTVWVHGPAVEVPTTEEAPRRPFGSYGVDKAEIERLLLNAARRDGLPATVVHPGHIVGPGWAPLNPAGHFDPEVFAQLARGERLALPNFGLETVHHVHADDVAQAFERALARRSAAIGESFHAVSPAALTLRGYAERIADWFGRPADLEFLPWDVWRATVTEEQAQATWDHIAHSPNCSIDKARQLLGYRPRYRSLQAVQEAVRWLIDAGELTL
jgi:nucleoside-diphosphate-sugar epimerase